VADNAVKTLGALTDKPQVWAVGESVHARLKDFDPQFINDSPSSSSDYGIKAGRVFF
jgi:hypothetical protein